MTKLLREHGVVVRNHGLSADHLTEGIKLYESGQSVAQVAAVLGFYPSSVYDALKRAGVEMRPAHEIDRRSPERSLPDYL